MRVSMHGGRGSAKHNDHNKSRAKHIDQTKTAYNLTWTCMDRGSEKHKIEDAEVMFYKRFFGATVEAQNEKYRKKGNYGRVKDVEQWHAARINQPREVIMQIGDAKSFVGGRELAECVSEFLSWKQEKYKGNLRIISLSEHVDEPDHADHVHVREIWFSHDDQGLPRPGIKAALREAGIPLPDPSAPEDENNYRMATVDAECRQKWQEIVMAHGYDIETEPDRTRTVGHMGQEAWNSYCKAMEDVKQEQAKVILGKRRNARVAEQNEADRKAIERDRSALDLKEKNMSKLIEAGRRVTAVEASQNVSKRSGLDIPQEWLETP